jgi:hypothetical protein
MVQATKKEFYVVPFVPVFKSLNSRNRTKDLQLD